MKKETLKSVLGWVVYLIILVALICGIPKGLTYALKTQYPMAAITSGSMWPALKKGDLVLIKGIEDKGEIKVGDVVVYENERGFTIHRVIKLYEDTLITKGDANNTSDSPIRYEEIIGKNLAIGERPIRIPKLGFLSMLINKGKIDG